MWAELFRNVWGPTHLKVVVFQRHLMQRCEHKQSLSVECILMGKSAISVLSFAL